MIREEQKAWSVAAVAYFKIVFRSFPGGTEKNYENSQSEYSVSGPSFEPRISKI
jgi:hypothetical protein